MVPEWTRHLLPFREPHLYILLPHGFNGPTGTVS